MGEPGQQREGDQPGDEEVAEQRAAGHALQRTPLCQRQRQLAEATPRRRHARLPNPAADPPVKNPDLTDPAPIDPSLPAIDISKPVSEADKVSPIYEVVRWTITWLRTNADTLGKQALSSGWDAIGGAIRTITSVGMFLFQAFLQSPLARFPPTAGFGTREREVCFAEAFVFPDRALGVVAEFGAQALALWFGRSGEQRGGF